MKKNFLAEEVEFKKHYMSKKKVKSFRMSEQTEYKLKALSKKWRMGTGKYLEKIIDNEYKKWMSGPRVVYNEKIINAEWIEKY